MSRPACGTDAILMASGFSRRFGAQNKLLLPFAGAPLALHTLNLVCGLHCFGRVFLVYHDMAVAKLAAGLRAEPLYNPSPHLGQRESIRLGVQASAAAYYLFCPCDQPLLDAATLTALMEKRDAGAIVAPRHGGVPGNPVLFSAAYRQELLCLAPGAHARDILRSHPGKVRWTDIPSALPLADVDTEEDARRLLEIG